MKSMLIDRLAGSTALSSPMFEAADKELAQLAADLKKATDEVKSHAEKVTTEMKNLGDATAETKTNADKALTEMNALSVRVADVEQKIARRTNGSGQDEVKTLGQLYVDDEQVKAFFAGNKRGQARLSIEGKTVINLTSGTATVGATTSVGTSLVTPDRAPMVPLPMRKLAIRDLLTPGETSSNAIEYGQQVTLQNLAATVAEGGQKPQSDMTFNLKSAPVRTIAHFMKASRQIMDDSPQLRTFIDGQLIYGLKFVEDAQLLAGDGTGQNLSGLMTQATAYSQPTGTPTITGETAIDRIRLALLQSALALYPATGIVLNPTDWAVIELLKDSQGRYIIGDAQGQIGQRLWGLPVVDTLAMTANNFLVGPFRGGAQVFDRMQTEVLLSTEDGTNFQTNMVTIRAEERLALCVYIPAGFITGTLP